MLIENTRFPTMCVDNFFNDPDKIRNMALSMPFYKCGTEETPGVWPGYRTKHLLLTNPDYVSAFGEKVLSLFFGPYKNYEYEIDTYFQKTNSHFFNGIDSGWVHKDDGTLFAGVIYLNKEIDENNGTTIYTPNDDNVLEQMNYDYKREMYRDFKIENTLLYDAKRKEHNSQFRKSVIFNNVYNRLIVYEGNHYHAENSFKMPEQEDRLTQVFFVNKLKRAFCNVHISKQVDI